MEEVDYLITIDVTLLFANISLLVILVFIAAFTLGNMHAQEQKEKK